MRPLPRPWSLYWLLVLLLVAIPAIADTAVGPAAEGYPDPDPSAAAFHAGPGSNVQFRQWIAARIRANPRDVSAWAQRAYVNYVTGFPDLGARDYAHALDLSRENLAIQRRIYWSWGWSLYGVGDMDGALAQWRRSELASSGKPFWVPYTYAVALWRLGRQDEAIAFFAAAVRTNPEWGTEDGLARRTDHWRPSEREAALAVFVAWKQHAAS